jgi:hypothetical protein
MLYLSKTIIVYRFYKILVIEPTTEVKAERIGAPSVKEIDPNHGTLSSREIPEVGLLHMACVFPSCLVIQ